MKKILVASGLLGSMCVWAVGYLVSISTSTPVFGAEQELGSIKNLSANGSELIEIFNKNHDKPRLILLLSPI